MAHPSADRIQHFTLKTKDWRQLEYLYEILSPYYTTTTIVSKQNSPSIQLVYQVYDILFKHLESYIKGLARKHVTWKVQIQDGLKAAQEKL
jgi:hypothetical protein